MTVDRAGSKQPQPLVRDWRIRYLGMPLHEAAIGQIGSRADDFADRGVNSSMKSVVQKHVGTGRKVRKHASKISQDMIMGVHGIDETEIYLGARPEHRNGFRDRVWRVSGEQPVSSK